jgi:molybdopterin-guanine dinucleotide biosynthesis protein A
MTELVGLLLAGGRSSRFGSDKALAVVDGQTLLARAEACLRVVCDGPIFVASGDGVSRPGVGDGQVADLIADAGPLSAIAAGLTALAAAGHDGGVAVLAVDHPYPSPALLELLAQGGAGRVDCHMARVNGRDQPLQAVWDTQAAVAASEAVRAGERSVLRFLATREVQVVDEFWLVESGINLDALRDVDRPEDLPGQDQ